MNRLRLEYRKASELADHPENWKHHPPEQLAALDSLITRVGWAGVVLYNERTSRLLDGHGRKLLEMSKRPDEEIPVLIGEWDEDQERLILLALDPIAGEAQADAAKLELLLRAAPHVDESLANLFAAIADDAGITLEAPDEATDTADEEMETLLDQAIQLEPAAEYVVIKCGDADEWERLKVALELKPVRRGGYAAGSPFDSVGTQRVVTAADLLRRLEG